MKKINYEIVGYAASFITSITFIPQVYFVYKRKSADDISYVTLYLNIFAGILWIIYGSYLESLQIIICDFIYSSVNLILIFQKIYYKNEIVSNNLN